MKKYILFSVLLLQFAIFSATAQTVYTDVNLAPSMVVYNTSLRNGQNDQNTELSRVRNAQLAVLATLNKANQLHERFHAGLQEVYGTVRNGVTMKYIYDVSSDIVKTLGETAELAVKHPIYAPFATQATNDFRTRALKLGADASSIIISGEKNLMDSGERQEILNMILTDLRIMRVVAGSMKRSIQYAAEHGLLYMLNPYNRWINQDRNIMRRILLDASSYDGTLL